MSFRGGDNSSVKTNDNCLTPPEIHQALGPFDLDPCFGQPRPWNTASHMYALEDGEDGLALPWFGRVWLNQPYSNAGTWAEKMAQHQNGIMLVFNRSETHWFQEHVFPQASAILHLARRLRFYTPEGNLILTKKGKPSSAGAPSVLIAYDDLSKPFRPNAWYLLRALIEGKLKGALMQLPAYVVK